MPGYFGYAMVLKMYVFAAGIVWLATAVLAVPKATRPFAKRAALLVVIYGTAGWCLLASVAGFAAGWRAGWRLAGGESWRTVIVGDPLVGRTIAWLSRKIRWPDPPLVRAGSSGH